jgi:glucosamine-6-phosphate deaminase
LDEYCGIADHHPASFRRYLHERYVARLPTLRAIHVVNCDATDPHAECARLGKLIRAQPIDVLLLGIGENAHLAFNDPPADCTSMAPYAVVKLDQACRTQQVGEGWFENLEAVPTHAISMSMTCIMSASSIIASVPDARKANAVQASVEGDISPMIPGAYLRRHRDCRLHVDVASAAKLPAATRLSFSSVVA